MDMTYHYLCTATDWLTKKGIKIFLRKISAFFTTRAYGAMAPEPLGCASHSYLLTEESVRVKRTNKHTLPIINTDCRIAGEERLDDGR